MTEILQFLAEHPDQVNAAAAVSALFVSAMSIVLTVTALYWQRQHNFRSVTPICSILTPDYENKISVKLKNTGLGPLIVTRLRVARGSRAELSVVSHMPELPPGMLWDTFWESMEGECLPAGEQVTLLELSGQLSDQRFVTARDNCRRRLRELSIEIEFEDIYQRKMPTKKETLEWFGRHFEEADA